MSNGCVKRGQVFSFKDGLSVRRRRDGKNDSQEAAVIYLWQLGCSQSTSFESANSPSRRRSNYLQSV